jgi:hypothetical protein
MSLRPHVLHSKCQTIMKLQFPVMRSSYRYSNSNVCSICWPMTSAQLGDDKKWVTLWLDGKFILTRFFLCNAACVSHTTISIERLPELLNFSPHDLTIEECDHFSFTTFAFQDHSIPGKNRQSKRDRKQIFSEFSSLKRPEHVINQVFKILTWKTLEQSHTASFARNFSISTIKRHFFFRN